MRHRIALWLGLSAVVIAGALLAPRFGPSARAQGAKGEPRAPARDDARARLDKLANEANARLDEAEASHEALDRALIDLDRARAAALDAKARADAAAIDLREFNEAGDALERAKVSRDSERAHESLNRATERYHFAQHLFEKKDEVGKYEVGNVVAMKDQLMVAEEADKAAKARVEQYDRYTHPRRLALLRGASEHAAAELRAADSESTLAEGRRVALIAQADRA
ncbi:MAG TPA: hypothetical protein VG406_07740, partial [Isosphaeraceae bacterium]|nr:hypothetical protein [Isosphaeraceae bacterium]